MTLLDSPVNALGHIEHHTKLFTEQREAIAGSGMQFEHQQAISMLIPFIGQPRASTNLFTEAIGSASRLANVPMTISYEGISDETDGRQFVLYRHPATDEVGYGFLTKHAAFSACITLTEAQLAAYLHPQREETNNLVILEASSLLVVVCMSLHNLVHPTT